MYRFGQNKKQEQLNSYNLQFQMNIVVLFKVEMLTFFLKQRNFYSICITINSLLTNL